MDDKRVSLPPVKSLRLASTKIGPEQRAGKHYPVTEAISAFLKARLMMSRAQML